MKRRIVPGGILALSLAVVLMAATASSASWAPGSVSVALGTWNCPHPSTPPTTLDQIPEGCLGSPAFASFNFGYHAVGTSTSQRFWLGVRGDTSSPRIAFDPRIGVSGEYAQTNNCPPTLSAGAWQIDGCLITVTFTPTGERKGPRRGTLSTGPGGPTMALTGYGEPRDSVPPDLKLSGDKTQDPQNDGPICDRRKCDVIVRVRCDEWCTVRATGRLTNVKRDKLRPDGPYTKTPGEKFRWGEAGGPELTKEAQRLEVRKALAEGKTVKAIVTVRAKDMFGNVATAKRTIKLVKNTGASPRPPKAAGAPYNTRVTIGGPPSPGTLLHGNVYSAARKCEVGRRVVVFKQQPGTDRRLGVAEFGHGAPNHWDLLSAQRKAGLHVYALVRREVRRHGLVCRSDRSRIYTVP